MRLLLTLTACLASSLAQQPLEENVSGGIRQFTTTLLTDLGKLLCSLLHSRSQTQMEDHDVTDATSLVCHNDTPHQGPKRP